MCVLAWTVCEDTGLGVSAAFETPANIPQQYAHSEAWGLDRDTEAAKCL